MLFEIGKLVGTPAAVQLLEKHAITAMSLVLRHVNGDFGDLCDEDKQANLDAIKSGSRILSKYNIGLYDSIYIITEAVAEDGYRESTCVLLPEEY